ncbi:tRNA-dihydrouridine synthase [Candidatus Latescibacterota bacterium]
MKRREFIQAAISSTALAGCSSARFNHRYSEPKKVYEPLTIKNLTIPNRIVFPAITTNYADDEGFVTERIINFHQCVADGGVGLSIIGATPIRKDWRLLPNVQVLDDDKYIEGFKKLLDSIKQNGSMTCIQLIHSGEQISSSEKEVEELVICFAEAAYRAKMAGADMIELNCASRYIIGGFLSPLSNKRNDKYGGSIENRTRFVREVLGETKKKVGENYPICCKISADEFADEGITIEKSRENAQILVDSGVDAIQIAAGSLYESRYSKIPTKEQGRRCYAYLAREIKDAVDIPVIAVGNILDLIDAEIVLYDGDADMVAMGRALIADPYLIAKTIEGKTNAINGCIQCRSCLNTLGKGLSCSVNINL